MLIPPRKPFYPKTTLILSEPFCLRLASTYGIIKGHGGYVDVYSKKGHGTTFSIYLPVTEEEIKAEKKFSGELVKGNATILLVDDEEMILTAGDQVLNKLGHEVFLANCGQNAIEIYKQNQDKIDMVLLDMVMPEMGGGETYDGIKKINPNVKVLLSSGYSKDGQATEILKRGCDGFIEKPFTLEELSQKLNEILNNPKRIR